MFNIKKLKISGFKSFPYPFEIEIPSGITGIIGPNGCGKSNIFEAIRWVMGESSSKSLRSSSMEELIFSGTDDLPEKNIAEVTLDLEMNEGNRRKYGDERLLVSRLIERGVGSFYKINDKDVRAKDINILFSDSGSGARSSSIISQGNIDQIINFKPLDRKIILEDAAGISGLQTRRHDSELKLNATENNLERISDNIAVLEKQQQSLKRQARQAENYQKISEVIIYNRKKLCFSQWKNSNEQISMFANKKHDFDKEITLKEESLKILEHESNQISKNLEQLEIEKLNLNKKLNEMVLEKETIFNRKNNLTLRRKEIENFLSSLEYDQTNENKRLDEIKISIKELKKSILSSENIEILKKQLDYENKKESELNENISDLESLFYSEIQLTLGKEFKKDNFIESSSILEKKRTEVEKELKKIAEQIQTRKDKLNIQIQKDSENEINQIKNTIKVLSTKRSENKKQTQNLKNNIEKKNKELELIYNSLIKYTTELNTLKKFTNSIGNSKESIVNLIDIKSGYEKAVYTALNYELDAEISKSKKYWLDNYKSELYELPKGLDSLLKFVQGPQQLNQILSQFGLVENVEDGFEKQKKLKVGQYIVSMNGFFWRWDGLFSAKQTEMSEWFSQIQKVNDLEEKTLQIEKKKSQLKENLDYLKKDENKINNEIIAVTKKIENIENILKKKEFKLSQLKNKFLLENGFIEKLIERYNFLLDHKNKVVKEISDIKHKLKLDNKEPKQKKKIQQTLQNLKNKINEKRSIINDLNKKILALNIKLNHDKKYLEDNIYREKEVIIRLDSYNSRIKKLNFEKKQLNVQPNNFEQKINHISAEIKKAENTINQKNYQIETHNNNLKINNEKNKVFLNEKNKLNDKKIRLEENLNFQKNKLEDLEEKINKNFQMHPSQMESEFKNIAVDQNSLSNLEEIIESLNSKRDQIGPVNLRAYIEQQEITNELDTMISERDDVMLAIKKLRRAIVEINQEGKKRLVDAFNQVNQNFSNLFKKFFVGGNAHLELVNSDDPLQTGIEIFAKPPGKKLSSISLLSGGEKTLTAISLIFSIFLIKPSPICILDEVDAALDDENVGKFCDILNEIKNQTKTKFLIVTHHKITMSMVDKIYGVTMNQKGISDVVSVNFNSQEYKEAI